MSDNQQNNFELKNFNILDHSKFQLNLSYQSQYNEGIYLTLSGFNICLNDPSNLFFHIKQQIQLFWLQQKTHIQQSTMGNSMKINVIIGEERCLTVALEQNSAVKDLKNILSDYGELNHVSFLFGMKTLSLDSTKLRDEGVREGSCLIIEQGFADDKAEKSSIYGQTQYFTKEVHIPEQSIERVEVYAIMKTIPFNSLQQPNNIKFAKTAPKWREVCNGLNFEGKCSNKECVAYEKLGWSHKGYGLFNLSKQIFYTKCQVCNQNLQQILNMGLTMGCLQCQGKGPR